MIALADKPFCLKPNIFNWVLAWVVGREANASDSPLLWVRTRIDQCEKVFKLLSTMMVRIFTTSGSPQILVKICQNGDKSHRKDSGTLNPIAS